MLLSLCVIGVLVVGTSGGPGEGEATYLLPRITTGTQGPYIRLTGMAEEEEDDGLDEINKEMEKEPYFDASMSPTYTAYLGKTATVTCIVHAAKSDKSVSWIKDLRILTVGRYTYTTDLRFEAIHQQSSKEWTLRVRQVEMRDQGIYECQITTKPIRTFTVFLKVVEPTVEVLGAPDIYVNRASMINLTCVVHHAPYPPKAITWYHGNETISYTSPRGGVSVVEERGETTTSFLLLQNARVSDTGTFTCQPEGMEAAVANLHILDGEHRAAMQHNSSCLCVPRLCTIIVVAGLIVTYYVVLCNSIEDTRLTVVGSGGHSSPVFLHQRTSEAKEDGSQPCVSHESLATHKFLYCHSRCCRCFGGTFGATERSLSTLTIKREWSKIKTTT